MTGKPRPGTLAYAEETERSWQAHWGEVLKLQQRKITAEQSHECIQCGSSTVGCRIGWACSACTADPARFRRG